SLQQGKQGGEGKVSSIHGVGQRGAVFVGVLHFLGKPPCRLEDAAAQGRQGGDGQNPGGDGAGLPPEITVAAGLAPPAKEQVNGQLLQGNLVSSQHRRLQRRKNSRGVGGEMLHGEKQRLQGCKVAALALAPKAGKTAKAIVLVAIGIG